MHSTLTNNLLMHNGPEKRPCGLDSAPEADRRRRRRNWVTDDEPVIPCVPVGVWAVSLTKERKTAIRKSHLLFAVCLVRAIMST